jgi:predicted nuclease of predicted toxin-antitoxin system
MHFLIDEQLPQSLCAWLGGRGHSAVHVADIGLSGAEDIQVWAAVVARGATLFTKDEDFIAIRQHRADGPSVVWLRIGNATNPFLFDWLSTRIDRIEASLAAGEAIVEVH